MKALEAFTPVAAKFLEAVELARDERHIGAHNRDVGVARADVALLDRAAGVDDGGVDPGGEVGR